MKHFLRVLFENISGGFVLATSKHGEMVFSRVSLKEYIEYFRRFQPDILSLSEIHLENAECLENAESDNDRHLCSSEMVRTIAMELDLTYVRCFPQSPSHLDTSKNLGVAILSKFPIVSYETFFLPNPKLEISKSDGSHWIMFDKGAQKVTLDIEGDLVNVVNLHYFPFHHFGRKLNEKAFSDIRIALVNLLAPEDDTPTIVTGDFNNRGITLAEAFPELFLDNKFQEAMLAETTVVGLKDQFDHILYTPGRLQIKHCETERNLSDHYALFAEMILTSLQENIAYTYHPFYDSVISGSSWKRR